MHVQLTLLQIGVHTYAERTWLSEAAINNKKRKKRFTVCTPSTYTMSIDIWRQQRIVVSKAGFLLLPIEREHPNCDKLHTE